MESNVPTEYEVTLIVVARDTGQKFELRKVYQASDQFDAVGKAYFDVSEGNIESLCDIIHTAVALNTEYKYH